jgi:hypothetical protein
MRFLRRLIVLGALAAGALYLKQLLDEQLEDTQTHPVTSPSTSPQPASSSNGSPSNGSRGATKAELYEEAQRLGIEGRSKMSKAELERAIRAAG